MVGPSRASASKCSGADLNDRLRGLPLPSGAIMANILPPTLNTITPSHCAERVAEGSLAAGGLNASPRILVGTRPWLMDLVRTGLGVGVVSSWLTPEQGLVLRPLAECAAAFGMMLATKRGRFYSPPVKAFVELALKSPRLRAATASTSVSGSAPALASSSAPPITTTARSPAGITSVTP